MGFSQYATVDDVIKSWGSNWFYRFWFGQCRGKRRDRDLMQMSGLNRKKWERRKKRIRDTM